ncbi:MAG: hypothetical protein ACRC2T_16385, partial [Thermoguttaceae bacterium]
MTIIYLFTIILITLLNVCVGIYVAVLFGYGPPGVKEIIDLLVDKNLLKFDLSNYKLGALKNVIARAKSLQTEVVSKIKGLLKLKSKNANAEEAKQTDADNGVDLEEMLKSVAEANVSDLLEDDADEIEMVAPLQELFDDNLVSALMEKGTESWLMGEKNVETSILKLNVVMMKSGKFSAELDARLRAAQGSADSPFVKKCINELREDCKNYLEIQATVTQQIQKRIDDFGELAYLAEEIDLSNMEQAAQIETTMSNLEHLNLNNPEETVTKLLKE